MKTIVLLPVRFYIFCISPLIGPSCRFHPTCSAYAVQAVEEYGAWKGLVLTVRRLVRCHPWSRPPFYDPPSKNNNQGD